MELVFPLSPQGSASLWLALALGLAFGVLLEQGGMGHARKVAGFFYFRDFAVLKIMFSAILTCAVGLFWLARIGWLDYDLIFVEPTYLWPQLSGGLIFGAGFAVGGLCPGTSCVALASGRVDGLALLLGMFLGIGLFNELFAWMEPFYRSGEMGTSRLPELLGVGEALTLAGLAAIALLMFVLIERHRSRATS